MAMYRFIKSNQIFPELVFLYQAYKGVDNYRKNLLGMLHVEMMGNQKVLVTTDGRRMHIFTPSVEVDIAVGDYIMTKPTPSIIQLRTAPVEYKFVNWQRVTPGDTNPYKGTSRVHMTDTATTGEVSQAYIAFYKEYQHTINFEFFHDLRGFVWDVLWIPDTSKGVWFQGDSPSGYVQAIVMPMNDE